MCNSMQLNGVMKLAKSIAEIRSDFPILSTKAHGKPLIYLDNGATTQKPLQVINLMMHKGFIKVKNPDYVIVVKCIGYY